jgi:hypothetical protein
VSSAPITDEGARQALAAFHRSAFGLTVTFVVSFLPISAYLLLAPGLFHWFGILGCGYFISPGMVRKA